MFGDHPLIIIGPNCVGKHDWEFLFPSLAMASALQLSATWKLQISRSLRWRWRVGGVEPLVLVKAGTANTVGGGVVHQAVRQAVLATTASLSFPAQQVAADAS
jgi:hypothetical protein